MYNLTEIKKIKNEYEIEEVNCLERPVAMVLNSYCPIYRNLYLFHEKMNRCYNLHFYDDIGYKDKISMKRAQIILEQELGILMHRVVERDEMHQLILEQLKKNNPVIVPGNLKEIYYSKFYNKENWKHSFLLHGYNLDNKLYFIYDSVQCENEKEMCKFCIPQKTLKQGYESYCNNFYEDGIYFIESNEVDRNPDYRKMILNGLQLFVNNRKKQPYFEIDLIQHFLQKENPSGEELLQLFEINNYKKVFLSEMRNLLAYLEVEGEVVEKLVACNQELLAEWRKVESKIAYYIQKAKKFELEKLLEKTLEKENLLLNQIKEILDKVQNEQEDIKQKTTKEPVIFINNEQNIIKQKPNDQYMFHFDTNQIYNNWFEDQAPKIVLPQNLTDFDEFQFCTSIKIESYVEWANFMVGVYIKDENGNAYLYGNNSMRCVCFEYTGIKGNMYEESVFDTEFQIEVRYRNRKLQLIYTDFNDVSKEIRIREVDLESRIYQMGIACKTWGSPNKLTIAVSNIDLIEKDEPNDSSREFIKDI